MQFDNRPPQNGRPEGGGRRRRSRRRRHFGEGGAPTPADVFAQPEFPQPVGPPLLSEQQLAEMSKAELNELAKTFDIENPTKVKKDELVAEIVAIQAQRSGLEKANGVLDVLPEGYGFLRRDGYLTGAADIYISQSQIRRFELRRGDLVAGQVRAPKENEKYYGIVKVEAINGVAPELLGARPSFDQLTPVVPAARWHLGGAADPTVRAIDLFAPLGRGQRALLVAPPEADVASILLALASAASASDEETQVIALLLDQRPEDAIAFADAFEGEAVATTFDDAPELHVATAELVLERAKRLAEIGRDVVVVVDSLARLARAASHTGRERPQNGVDPLVVQRAKRFFGAARALEEGGSLTIVAALPPGGGKLEHVLLEELGPMANARVVISKMLLEARVVPAIDLRASGSVREERLLSEIAWRKTVALRRRLRGAGDDLEAAAAIADAVVAARDVDAFLGSVSADGAVVAKQR